MLHFVGGLVREGDRENVPGRDSPVLDQERYPVSEHPCLSRTGAGNDQQRAFKMLHGFLLRRIEAFKDGHKKLIITSEVLVIQEEELWALEELGELEEQDAIGE